MGIDAISSILFLLGAMTALSGCPVATPGNPACAASAPCPTGQERICDHCVSVSVGGLSNVGTCVPDLCDPDPTHPRCSVKAGTVCVNGTCTPAAGILQPCAAGCNESSYCLDTTTANTPLCIAAVARAAVLAVDLTQLGTRSNAALAPQVCVNYQVDEGAACDTDWNQPGCSRCAPGLHCAGGTCQRSCAATDTDPSTGHNPSCTCTHETCALSTASNTTACATCNENGEACTAATSSTCCDPLAAGTCTRFSRCCRPTQQPCAQRGDCCGTSGTNGGCAIANGSLTGVCDVCSPPGGACNGANGIQQCCMGAARCDQPAGSAGHCCPANTGHCNPNGAGCETNLLTDPMNCGACGNVCPSNSGGTPVCANGQCMTRCSTGFANCTGTPGGACSTNIFTDPNNCGGCNQVCSAPVGSGMTATCQAGHCVRGCPVGQSTCNIFPQVCYSIATDATHCGAGCVHCPTNYSCVAGRCTEMCIGRAAGNCFGVSIGCCAGLVCNLTTDSCEPPDDAGVPTGLAACAMCPTASALCAPIPSQPGGYACGSALRCLADDGTTCSPDAGAPMDSGAPDAADGSSG